MSIVNLVKSIQAGETYIFNDSPKRTANMINHCFQNQMICEGAVNKAYYGVLIDGFNSVLWSSYFNGEIKEGIKASEIINHVHPLIHVQLPLNY